MTSEQIVPSREQQAAADRIAAELKLIQQSVPLQRRLVRAGQPLGSIYIVNTGIFKLVNVSADGRQQVAGLHFRGDWIGFDGLADGRHACDAVAMDTGEVWSIRYDALLDAAGTNPALLRSLHSAMSRQQGRDRESMLSLCTLGADARVADFLRQWANTLAERGLRTDQITLRMTRAEIGNYLGLTLETVSRALSRLARGNLIRFDERGRRDIRIPRVQALDEFVQRGAAPAMCH